MSSSFDKDFGRRFEPVEETMVLGDLAAKLVERYAVGASEIAKEHRLRISDPTGDEWEYPVRGEVMIGRAPDNHITLNDRAVSRHHLALNTDGALYWFQDMNSGNGTQVNGEFVQEGWLVGGEEIVVGNSRLYFLLPDRDIEAPADLVEALSNQGLPAPAIPEVPGSAEGDAARPVNPEVQSSSTPGDSSAPNTSWLIGFVFIVGLLCASIAGLWLYRKNQKAKDIDKPVLRPISPLEKATTLVGQGEILLKQKKWLEADKMFRQAMMLLPPKEPLRMTISARAQDVLKELRAKEHYQQAHKLYHYKFKIKAALRHIHQIPEKTDTYPQAIRLRNLIRKKELDTQLSMARLLVEANKKDDAVAKVQSVLQMDPTYQAATSLLKKLQEVPVVQNTLPTPVPQPRSRRGRRRSTATASLQQGLGYYRSGSLTRAVIFFRRQESAASRRSDRRRAGQYRRHVQSYQNGWEKGVRAANQGNLNRAISLLTQAYRADQALGGSFSSKVAQRLSRLLYQRGKQQQSQGNYNQAARDFKSAKSYDSRNTQAHLALQSLRKKAKALLEEGEVLIGVSNNDARTKIRQAQQLLSPSDPLYRKASQLLNRAQ